MVVHLMIRVIAICQMGGVLRMNGLISNLKLDKSIVKMAYHEYIVIDKYHHPLIELHP